MNALLLPENTTIKDISWSLISGGIATIDASGLLTPVTTGKVTVRASAWDTGKIGVKDIVIINRLVESVSIEVSEDTITTDETLQFTVLVSPGNATNKSIIWSVVPDGFATIDSDGLLTPSAAGTVTVIASATDGSDVSDSVDITIQLLTETEKTVTPDLKIYPNPTRGGKFVIQGIEGITGIAVLDLHGRIMREYKELNRSLLEVEINSYPGMHIIRLTNGKNVIYRKLLIE